MGRRWVVLVLLPVLLCCGGGMLAGVPIVWAIGVTAEASKGAPSPQAAVNVYLMALGYKDDAGLLPVLDDDQGDKLMKQWKEYLAEMRRGGTQPSKLEFDFGASTQVGKRRVDVDAAVSPVWWGTNGHAISSVGDRHTWRFGTHEDGGWQIDSVRPYAWCGGTSRWKPARDGARPG